MCSRDCCPSGKCGDGKCQAWLGKCASRNRHISHLPWPPYCLASLRTALASLSCLMFARRWMFDSPPPHLAYLALPLLLRRELRDLPRRLPRRPGRCRQVLLRLLCGLRRCALLCRELCLPSHLHQPSRHAPQGVDLHLPGHLHQPSLHAPQGLDLDLTGHLHQPSFHAPQSIDLDMFRLRAPAPKCLDIDHIAQDITEQPGTAFQSLGHQRQRA